MNTKIYTRKNGRLGASCDRVADTGHTITEKDGRFTVFSVDDPDKVLVENVTREEAEKAIERDWREF